MRYVMDFLIAIIRLDWKSCVLARAGFLLALVSDPLAGRYGSMVGLVVMTTGWWLVLGGLLMAKHGDWPIWKIFK